MRLARYNVDGDLDTSFDDDGKVTTHFAESGAWARGQRCALQSDGKIVVVGYTHLGNRYNFGFAVARYNIDGSLDSSFDSDGKLIADHDVDEELAESVAVQSDGKIVVGGGINGQIGLIRYNIDGTLDTSFHGDGTVTTDIGASFENEWCTDLVLQGDGKIVVGGTRGRGDYFVLLRYNANGTLDTSFSGDGKVTTDFAPLSARGVQCGPAK